MDAGIDAVRRRSDASVSSRKVPAPNGTVPAPAESTIHTDIQDARLRITEAEQDSLDGACRKLNRFMRESAAADSSV